MRVIRDISRLRLYWILSGYLSEGIFLYIREFECSRFSAFAFSFMLNNILAIKSSVCYNMW